MGISNRLKEVRTHLNMNQSNFAGELGILPKTLSLWESGKRDIPVTHLISISNKWNISLDWLVLDIGMMHFTDESDIM